MKSIEIYISNMGYNININIDVQNYKMIINDKERTITQEKIDELIRIIRTWKDVYENNSPILDSEEFKINVNTTKGSTTIKGRGNYPENYYQFKEWIGELNG